MMNGAVKRYFDVILHEWIELDESCELKLTEEKPYPHEHSARIKDPDLFDDKTFRRKSDGTIYGKIKVPATADVIWGKLKEHNKPSDNPIPQAIRFPTKDWTEAEAKKWLKDNDVKYERFEPASEKSPHYFHAKIVKDSIREVDGHLQIEGYASSAQDAADRDNDFVEPEAFESAIKHYLDNPILLYMHRMWEPIGRVVSMTIDKVAGFWIRAMISNAPDVENIRIKIKEQILRAFSIGYLPIDGKVINDVFHLTNFELLETSVVTIGSNRYALFDVAKSFRYGTDLYVPETQSVKIIEEKLAEIDFDLLRKIMETSGRTKGGVTAPTGPHSNKPPQIKTAPEYSALDAAMERLAADIALGKLNDMMRSVEQINSQLERLRG